MALFILKSKEGRGKRGTFLTLYGFPSVLRLVKDVASFITSKRGRYKDNDRLFSENIATRIRKISKFTAATFELPEELFARHSLRSGGSTSLFVSGVSLEDIRRFGMWKSVTFHEYCRLGHLQYRHLCDLAANSSSLVGQLCSAEGKTKGIKFAESIYMGPEDISRRTGGQWPLEMRWRSPGSRPEQQSDDAYQNESEQRQPIDRNMSQMGSGSTSPWIARARIPQSINSRRAGTAGSLH